MHDAKGTYMKLTAFSTLCRAALWLLVVMPLCACAQSGSLRDALIQRRLQAMQAAQGPATLAAGIQLIRNVSYGDDPHQRFDVYVPAHPEQAPVIFLVHGGAWAFGDKAARGVVQNKVNRWVPRGFVLISIDYRMLPQASPLMQADDVAHALAYAQHHVRQWGGDPSSFILMGHSAGAHLVALISTDTALAQRYHAEPWLGTVSLDSAALDLVAIMQARHFPLYDRAFGAQPDGWMAASPLQQMHGPIAPFLAVCSSRRKDSCSQAQRFVAKANAFGSRASVIEENKTHEQINEQLGADADYTHRVESFMRTLSPAVAQRLDGT